VIKLFAHRGVRASGVRADRYPKTAEIGERRYARCNDLFLESAGSCIPAEPRDDVQRRIILKLLAEEEATLREAPSKKDRPPQQAA